ncbi:uncharacterized protein MELLADRAFT_103732 [Melampsora larici-populina 98AG31]|uniref:Glutaminase A central domain-containing protein n=1 Tax=Melampsora larici-populina (strain 98AG31 / pathotype 3-4-7) TaxID=747676 RepID=F4RC72_MELLP|nr:uncharacterized protein MELLADRAFT_103732 [Melampsora larici-populina 98AG31]EGG10000.1 hypothetical protein MELLADRAFT_103732 [Melampsora larici-populina 98AG31]
MIGIGVMSEISLKVGVVKEGNRLRKNSEDYIEKWIDFSVTKDRSHTKLAYQDADSWGTFYNLNNQSSCSSILVSASMAAANASLGVTRLLEFNHQFMNRSLNCSLTKWSSIASCPNGDKSIITNLNVKYARNINFKSLIEVLPLPGKSKQSSITVLTLIMNSVRGSQNIDTNTFGAGLKLIYGTIDQKIMGSEKFDS